MTYYPFAPENGATYVLSNPANGVKAVFNDLTDPSNVGMITDISGLDSPEVRESAEDLVQADGGTHGYFYFSRRPIVISANVFGHASVAARNLKVDLADRAAQLLRVDGTLSWKPCKRSENMIVNPRAAIDLFGVGSAAGGPTLSRTTTVSGAFATGIMFSGTTSTTNPNFFAGGTATTPTGATGMPVVPNRAYTVSGSMELDSLTSGTVTAMNLRVNWYKADGSASSILTLTNLPSQSNPVVGTAYSMSSSALIAPSDAAFALIRVLYTTSSGAVLGSIVTGLGMASNDNWTAGYQDGDTAGWYWQGNPHTSPSGDYIEMFTVVRRNGPFRQTGGWVKELNIPLVSEYATVQSTAQKTASGAGGVAVSVENRGSWDSNPILRIAGASASNPTITNNTTGEVLRTTGTLIVASGETLEIDTLNHTAYFTSGARNGQSANRFIDFNLTQWPEMRSGTSTYTLSGTGTLTILWRDTWV